MDRRSDGTAPDDVSTTGNGDPAPDRTPVSKENALRARLELGREELSRPTRGLALSGLSAGPDVGLGPPFTTAPVGVAAGVRSEPSVRLAAGLVSPTGFVFVVLRGTEPFAGHTTLAVLPALDGEATVARVTSPGSGASSTGRTCSAEPSSRPGRSGSPRRTGPSSRRRPSGRGAAEPVEVGTTAFAAVPAGWLVGLLSWMGASVGGSTARAPLAGTDRPALPAATDSRPVSPPRRPRRTGDGSPAPSRVWLPVRGTRADRT